MEQMIRSRLDECHVLFPSYGERSAGDIATLAKLFEHHLAGYRDPEIAAAFDFHMRNGDRFPVVADITAALTPRKVYQFDGGPKGFGGMYDPSHPYVRLQERLGTTGLESYARYISPIDGIDLNRLQIEARDADFISIDNSIEDPPVRVGGSGFKRIAQ